MLRCSPLVLAACVAAAPPPAILDRAVPNLSDVQVVYHAYQVVLDRIPDPGGLDGNVGFLQGGGTLDGLFGGLLGSPEFAGRPDLHDPAGYITRLYRVLLEREPDPGGLAGWTAAAAPDGSNWAAIFGAFAASPEYTSIRRPIAGVHFAIPIDPTVDLSDAAFVRHMYETVLGREPDDGGLRVHIRFARANGRAADFAQFAGSAEVAGNPVLRDPASFVARLYAQVLGRAGSPGEVAAWASNLGEPDARWLAVYGAFIASPEYKAHACVQSYYTYDEPIARGAPLLDDLVTGHARIQGLGEAAIMSGPLDGSKLAWFTEAGQRYAFARVQHADPSVPNGVRFNIALFAQSAAHQLDQISGDIFDPADYAGFAYSMLDPQLAIDNSICPRRYILTMECDGALCMSYSTTPTVAASWSPPVRAIAGTASPFRSASVGRTVFDHKRAYLGWTVVDDANQFDVDEGNERVTSSAIAIPDGVYDRGEVSEAAFGDTTVMTAEPNINCTSSWDCNARDGQDWRREGAYFYLIYNGANYFRCERGHDDLWGIAVARSADATGSYDERSQPILGDQSDTCDISYPMVHAQDGRLVVTYASHDPVTPHARWAELVWQ